MSIVEAELEIMDLRNRVDSLTKSAAKAEKERDEAVESLEFRGALIASLVAIALGLLCMAFGFMAGWVVWGRA